jgi:NAD(P)-dependent dehydrogenase (short-subunit alcohol dehydrogenase family)
MINADFWLPHQLGYGFTPTRRGDTYEAIDPLKLNLSDKKVLITGGARGIGREIALSYAKAGASGIAILDILDCTPAVESDLQQAAVAAGHPGPDVLSLVLDVTDLAAVTRAAQTVRARLGAVDILVNNAGYLDPYTKLGESNPDQWWRSWEVNVRGVYLMTRMFLPLVLQSTDKTIVVISSVGAHHTMLGGSGYETTKLAVLKINNYLMLEYGSQGLLAYAVAPGGVNTEMAKDFPRRDLLTDTPRMVADTITFLTQERREWLAARYIDSRWDMTEMLEKREAIIDKDLLKVKLQVV